MASYIAFLRKEAKSDFGVSFPDLPGCVTAGKTLDEARRFAAEALALHLQGLAEDGEQAPAPSTLEQAVAHPDFPRAVPFLVDAPTHGRAVRVNVTLEAGLLGKIDAYTEQTGISRSSFLAYAALRELPQPRSQAVRRQVPAPRHLATKNRAVAARRRRTREHT